MTVTRDVISDLLAAYFSGEASADTRRLVEDFFRQDPEFERVASASAQAVPDLRRFGAAAPSGDGEKAALERVRAILRRQRLLFAIALTLTANAVLIGFSLTISDGHSEIHWGLFRLQRLISAAMLVSAFVSWILYFRRSRRTRKEILK
jgi:anti-sigma factor RsiW